MYRNKDNIQVSFSNIPLKDLVMHCSSSKKLYVTFRFVMGKLSH